MVRFVCPSCWASIELADDAAGRRVRCPHCHAMGTAAAKPTSEGQRASGRIFYSGAALIIALAAGIGLGLLLADRQKPTEHDPAPIAAKPPPVSDDGTIGRLRDALATAKAESEAISKRLAVAETAARAASDELKLIRDQAAKKAAKILTPTLEILKPVRLFHPINHPDKLDDASPFPWWFANERDIAGSRYYAPGGPEFATSDVGVGNKSFAAGNFAKAAELYALVVERAPGYAGAHVLRGDALAQIAIAEISVSKRQWSAPDFIRATESWKRGMDLGREQLKACVWHRLGQLAEACGERAEARKCYQNARGLNSLPALAKIIAGDLERIAD